MNIIKLTSENVKRLSAVEITPKDNVVVIGGKNGQGKSSVLDSIIYALGGDPDVKMPVRRGEEKAKVIVDLGEIVVSRTFTAAGGTSLVVTNADGAKQSSPQAILDSLTGKLTFDPLDFARQKPEKQSEILRSLIGLDFKASDAKHDELYQQRTAVNREARHLESRLSAMPRHEGLPDLEVSAASILEQQEAAIKKNQKNAYIRAQVVAAIERCEDAESEVGAIQAQIADLENRLASSKAVLAGKKSELADAEKAYPKMIAAVEQAKHDAQACVDEDLTVYRAKISEVETTNRKIRESKQREELVKQFKGKSEEADKITAELEKLESTKRKATTEAKYPVAGLLFDTAGGIQLDGIPFAQCSSAEQLKVSVAIGFALNPKLKVVLIRDGSLLDDTSMVTLCEMAKAANAQVWIERVGTDAQTSVVIEDGHIVEGDLL